MHKSIKYAQGKNAINVYEQIYQVFGVEHAKIWLSWMLIIVLANTLDPIPFSGGKQYGGKNAFLQNMIS